MPCRVQVVDQVPQLVSTCFGLLQLFGGEIACCYILPGIAQDASEEAIDDFPPPLLILSIAGRACETERTNLGATNFTPREACTSLAEATPTGGALRLNIARIGIRVPACEACALLRGRTDYSSLAAALLSACVALKRERV